MPSVLSPWNKLESRCAFLAPSSILSSSFSTQFAKQPAPCCCARAGRGYLVERVASYMAAVCRYERALVYMHKMPRIWLDYLEFLSAQVLPLLVDETRIDGLTSRRLERRVLRGMQR
eukprot:197967-Pleurochrysis_carterae.AAC.3